MTARSTPYPPPGYPIRIGGPIWAGCLETVRMYATRGYVHGRRGSEALVYLGGVVAGAEIIATALYRLNHAPQGDRVVVTPDEARWLLETLRTRDEKLVAQLHSHRGAAGHSHGDDAWATSFHDGYLSIVIPHFGTGVATPVDCAVLEYRDGEFIELTRDEVARRIRIHPDIAERVPLPVATAPVKETPWRTFALRLKSIARKPR
jgi:hypothetical protein